MRNKTKEGVSKINEDPESRLNGFPAPSGYPNKKRVYQTLIHPLIFGTGHFSLAHMAPPKLIRQLSERNEWHLVTLRLIKLLI